MKKIIAAFLVLILTASSFVCFAQSEAGDRALPKAKVKAMTVLGDSVATGYGLEGYDESSDNAGILSYANLTASYYGLTLGDNYFNYAKDGATSADLVEMLSSELTEEERANIAKSDVIVVSVGGNDLLELLLSYMKEFLALEQNATPERVITKLSKMTQEELKDFEKKAENFYKSKEKDVKDACERIGENISSVYEKLRLISPNAQIFVQSVYNPANELPQYKALSIVNAYIFESVLEKLNYQIYDVAEEKGMHLVDVFAEFGGRKEDCTNIAGFDVHPNEYGHSLIADALCFRIDVVYDELSSGNDNGFTEGKFPWIWFAGTAVVVALAVPTVFFVVKKSSGIKE